VVKATAVVAKSAVVLAIAGASCRLAPNPARESSFEELFPMEMNSSISLAQREEFGGARTGRSFSLLLQNRTDERIRVSWQDNPRVFRYSGETEGWIEISERSIHAVESETLDPVGEGLVAIVVGVAPDVEPSDAPAEVRVVVVGQIVSGGTLPEKEVGAFVDVTIYP
jgi:hypothetical protein